MSSLKLKVNKEIKKALPKMFPEDYEALKESIKEHGLKEPIEVMPDGTVVDGHHRLQACKELGIKPRFRILENIKTVEEAKEYTALINIARRHMTAFQRAKAGMYLYELEKEKAKKRMAHGGPKGTSASIDDSVGRVDGIVAKLIGLSETTFSRARRIIEAGPKELQRLVEEEKISIYHAYKLVQLLEIEDKEYRVPKQTKQELLDIILYSNDMERPKEILKVEKILEVTNIVKSWLENEDKEIRRKIEKKWKKYFYTADLDANEVWHDIQSAKGFSPDLKTVHLPYEQFANEPDPEIAADRFFKRFGGRYIDTVTVKMVEGEVDPYEWKKYKEEKKQEKRQKRKNK